MFSTSATFVNQNNKNWVVQQLKSRPSEKVPKNIEKATSFELLEKEIKPLEKRAVIYEEGIENGTIKEVFLRFLNQENTSPLSLEIQNKIHEIKNSLLQLRQKFSNLIPNLNCLKILRIQLAANANILIKDKDFCQIKPPQSQAHPNRGKQSLVEKFADLFAQQMDYFFRSLAELEEKIVEGQVDFRESFQEIEKSKNLIKLSLTAASQLSEKNKKIKDTALKIQHDLDLLSSLQLAPHTLLPLAILVINNNAGPINFSWEVKEFGELLEEQFSFACYLIEILCTAGLKMILQQGSHVKNYKKEIGKFFKAFKEEFVKLHLDIQKNYQSAYRNLYIKPSQFSDQYFQSCQEVLKKLKPDQIHPLPKVYYGLLTTLDTAKRAVKSEFLVDGLIREHLASIYEDYFNFYNITTLSLEHNLKKF